MGWTADTLFHSLFFGLPKNLTEAETFFGSISSGSSVLLGHLLSLVLTAIIVSSGIKKGIEKVTRYFMPILFIIIVILAIWATSLSGAWEGYKTFLLKFDFNELRNPQTIRNAFTQAFFSLSLGIGIMVTYASYLNKKSNLPKLSVGVASLDTLVGLMAGFITFPIVLTFGLSDAISESTVGALFISIPTGLGSYGTAGRIAVNVDNTNDDFAEFQFELEHNAVAGTVVDTTPAFGIFRGKASSLGGSGNTVYNQVRIPVGASDGSMVGLAFSNDLDTGLCRVGANSMAIACGGVQSLKVHQTSITVRGELNLISQNESPTTKYLDVAFLSNTFNIRRLSGGDAGHTNAMVIQSNLRIDGNFNDTSDGKLKKNVVALADGAIALVKKLKPVTFDWKETNGNNNVSGFIAQDVKEVIPNLINGKEWSEEDQSSRYTINTIGVVAHLTKALQEAIAKIELLETKVATLEAE